MNVHPSERLTELARKCIREMQVPDLQYAFVGGSVGRGDADEWSDVDVTICVDDASQRRSSNVVYEGEFVQVDFATPLRSKDMEYSPMKYRFLLESKPLYDPHGDFQTLRETADRFFRSGSGRQKLFEDWRSVVEGRKRWASASVDAGQMAAATAAGGAAWTDAVFMVMFFERGSLSTGALIPTAEKLCADYQDYARICKWMIISENDVPGILRAVERFRVYLRVQFPDRANDFCLSPLQDALNARKAKRLVAFGQLTNLAWQLAGEAFWLFLETADGLPLDDYLAALPVALRNDLERVGFVTLDVSSVRELCAMSDGLVRRAEDWLVGGG